MTASGKNRSFRGFSWSLNALYHVTPSSQELEQEAEGDRVVPDSSSFVLGKAVDPGRARRVMGRGKIEIKRIENPTSRQVTFSKRRGGLMKKGHELAVLCDADVAVIIFSSSGKMFEFASSGMSMREILERYSKCPDGAGQVGGNCDFMSREVVRLRQQVERLQETQRHMQGEDLQVLSIPDLLNLEQQLDTGASRVRARKASTVNEVHNERMLVLNVLKITGRLSGICPDYLVNGIRTLELDISHVKRRRMYSVRLEIMNQLLLEEVEELRRKEKAFLSANEDLRQKLADLKRIPEAAAVPAGTSGGPNQLVASIPTQYEAGGSSSHQAAAVYPTGHPNLRDPQTSQTSLHLGLFPESVMPSSSRRTSQQSPTEQGESSMRWEHPHYRSQK